LIGQVYDITERG